MELLLNNQELLDLGTVRSKLRIICLSGSCWITLAGDDRDYILHAGQHFTNAFSSHLLITAMASCRLQGQPHEGPVRAISFWSIPYCRG